MGVDPVTGTMLAMSLASTAAGAAQSRSAAKQAAAAGKKGQRSYLGETMGALDVQEKILQRIPGLERKYQPEMQALQRDTLMGQMGIMDQTLNKAIMGSTQLGNRLLDEYSPTLLKAMEQGRTEYYKSMGSSTEIMNEMEKRALEGIRTGRGLSEEDKMYAEQAARTASAARGMQMGNQGIANEVLMNYNIANQRERQRLGDAQTAISNRMQLNSAGLQAYGTPLSTLVSQTNPLSYLGLAQQMNAGLGSQLFQPESEYNANVMGSNANVNVQSALAAAQAKAGMAQGLMSLGGQLASAGMGYAGATKAANIEAAGRVDAARISAG